MQVELFDGFPHAELLPKMRTLLARAKRVDAAIAFVTRGGTGALRELLHSASPPEVRLVASVRFPSDLEELDRLSQKPGCSVWIHTGFRNPKEENADRGQFHSKLVLIERDGDERVVVVGSHNWTENALRGYNLEAGVVFHCVESDDIAQQARRHIEACIAESQPFDPDEMRFYKTLQRDLHVNLGSVESQAFPGFEEFKATVMHAEDHTPNGASNDLQLFVPVRDPHTASFFANDRCVQLFLYPRGSLHGHQPPRSQPVLFDGTVTMVNATRDAPVDQRRANCQMTDLLRPVLTTLPGNVPAPTGEVSQVVARLNRVGPEDLPIYHAKSGGPKLRLEIEYTARSLDELAAGASSKRQRPRHDLEAGRRTGPESVPVFEVPLRLEVAGGVSVPSRELYAAKIERQLLAALYGSEFWTILETAKQKLIDEPSDKFYLSRFVYTVGYRFTKEALARAQQQMKLF